MPHESTHQAINFNDNITVENYTEQAPHEANYKFPVSFTVQERPGGELEQSGEGASGTFRFTCRYQFGRYNPQSEQYTEIIEFDSGYDGDINSNFTNTFMPSVSIPNDMGANGPTNATRDCNIKSAADILTLHFLSNVGMPASEVPSAIVNYELIGFKIITAYWTGQTDETELKLLISNLNGVYDSGFKERGTSSSQMSQWSYVNEDLRVYGEEEEEEELVVESEEIDDEDTLTYEDLIFSQEEVSSTFGVQGVEMSQTFLFPYDPFSGLDINTSIFQNTNQGLLDANQDGRIELGMFSFDDDNIAKDNFPDILSAPFSNLIKENLVINGDCKYVEKVLCRFHVGPGASEDTLYKNNAPIVLKPEGDWGFLSFKTMKDSNTLEAYGAGEDSQGLKGYGGRHGYVPFSHENNKGDEVADSYWGEIYDGLQSNGRQKYVEELFGIDSPQYLVNQGLSSLPPLADYRDDRKWNVLVGSDGNELVEKPHVAMWLSTNEAYSNKRCLCFQNYQIWDADKMDDYVQNSLSDYPFNYLTIEAHNNQGNTTTSSPNYIGKNQYRVLNQFTKIYDKFSDAPINPYSSLKIKFKMKTTLVIPEELPEDTTLFNTNPLDESLGVAPQVDVGILHAQWNVIPLPDTPGINYKPGASYADGYYTDYNYDIEEEFQSPGSFNSIRYPNASTFENQEHSPLGGMGRFQNTIMNEWQDFEFSFNLTGEHVNRGLIYGVPYGGTFDDEANNGAVEIMLNHNSDSSATSGAPVSNPGEIYFKIPGYQDNPPPQSFKLIHPNGTQVTFQHGPYNSGTDYSIVATGLGDAGNSANQRTGLQSNGKFLEAYVMYVDSVARSQISMDSDLKYGGSGEPEVCMVLAYWDSENWTYDDNNGYDPARTFRPNQDCFILARVYSSEQDGIPGITAMDQYISNESDFPTDGIGNLFLFLQTGNNFNGRVLIDNIECYESYEFTPEVDVRKKISVGNYGIADLTQYYDENLQPEEYKDSQAPLEAQFYFYPQYPTNELFVDRTPIYQDFKKGRFYIHDINWGDGSPNEFTNTPEQINESTALYHTYETNGIFEITGTMLRVKVDEEDNIVGVAHNKKFKLRININPGLDEDFQYFGSDGYSFIPFRNTTPIIGGISKQSSYYKKIKRQLGFLDNDEKISIDFKYKSDKLKTELALLKMENQSDDNLEVLPNYLIPRFGKQLSFYHYNVDVQNLPGTDLYGTHYSDIVEPQGGPGSGETRIRGTNENGGVNVDAISTVIQEMGYQLGVDVVVDMGRTIQSMLPAMTNGQGNYQPFMQLHGVGKFFMRSQFTDLPTSEEPDIKVITKIYLSTLPTANFTEDDIYQNMDYTLEHGDVIYNGITPIREELGKGIGDCDITSIKYYNTPKSIWELFGFNDKGSDVDLVAREGEFINRRTGDVVPAGTLYHIHPNDGPMEGAVHNPNIQGGTEGHDYFDNTIGLPISNRYWKNIIPKDYSIFNREGLGGDLIDTYSEQDWIDNFYYPVLPKLGQDGNFIGELESEDLSIYPNNKIPFPLNGEITNENELNQNLQINLFNEKLESDVLDDDSGNENIGILIQDYNAKFEDESLVVKKSKPRNIFKTSTNNGAF